MNFNLHLSVEAAAWSHRALEPLPHQRRTQRTPRQNASNPEGQTGSRSTPRNPQRKHAGND